MVFLLLAMFFALPGGARARLTQSNGRGMQMHPMDGIILDFKFLPADAHFVNRGCLDLHRQSLCCIAQPCYTSSYDECYSSYVEYDVEALVLHLI